MTQRRVVIAAIVLGTLTLASLAGVSIYRRVVGVDRVTRETPDQLRQQIVALDAERAALREKLLTLSADAPLMYTMPDTPVRVVVPTSLLRTLVERVIREVADRIVIRVADVSVRRTGTIRRRITLGDYDLRITVQRVTATMTAGAPALTFGGNRIAARLPLRLAAGTGQATVQFGWDGRAVAGAVCGDMTVTETVTGRVVPRTYPVAGALELEMGEAGLVLRPRLPKLTLHVDIEPSDEAWAAVRKVIDSKRGLCGVILDRVDIVGAVRKVIAKGFDVRVPTDRAKPIALPIGLAPTLTVRGTPVSLAIKIAELSLTPDALWLGATVATAPAPPSRSRPPS